MGPSYLDLQSAQNDSPISQNREFNQHRDHYLGHFGGPGKAAKSWRSCLSMVSEDEVGWKQGARLNMKSCLLQMKKSKSCTEATQKAVIHQAPTGVVASARSSTAADALLAGTQAFADSQYSSSG